MTNYYVYAYCDPRFECIKNKSLLQYIPFYIGMGKNERYLAHLKRSHNNCLNMYITFLRNENIKPIVLKLKENMTVNNAKEYESLLIDYFGVLYDDSGFLLNKFVPSKCGYYPGTKNFNSK